MLDAAAASNKQANNSLKSSGDFHSDNFLCSSAHFEICLLTAIKIYFQFTVTYCFEQRELAGAFDRPTHTRNTLIRARTILKNSKSNYTTKFILSLSTPLPF
jgi:hypothetical protein